MTLRKFFCGILNALYIVITAFLVLCTCGIIIAFLGTVLKIFDATKYLSYAGFYVLAYLFFSLNIIISGLISFYNKTFSRISFILGLVELVAYVLWYNYIIVFRPDLYIIIP